ncbi:hypothetical protein GCM10009665_54930 [Kitasatospora nipponensis]|uniref:Uncharacterized protein n=1 Tax=Kitasatospora nipponensis TaxID=258049 RepID=A0ABN1WNL0_9ACTN
MMVNEDGWLHATLVGEGRWEELLGLYRQARARGHAQGGERAAVRESARLGHELALAAPAPVAAGLFDPVAGPATAAGERDGWTGPLWEVLATRHPWQVLDPLLRAEPVRTLAAHTRVLLGEDLAQGREEPAPAAAGEAAIPLPRPLDPPGAAGRPNASSQPGRPGRSGSPGPSGGRGAAAALEPPLVLRPWEQAGWEPEQRVTGYRPGGSAASALFALPDNREGLGPVRLPAPGAPQRPATAADPADPGPPPTGVGPSGVPSSGPLPAEASAAEQPATAALRALSGWLSARCLRGSAPQAAALLVPPELRDPAAGPTIGGYLSFAAAYPALVRAGSGAGAYGRSAGAALGRLAAWRALAAMADPSGRCTVAEVDALVARMRCFTWCEPSDEVWHLHLALEDPATGLAWAVSGADYD